MIILCSWFLWGNPGFLRSLKSSDFPQESDLWPGIWELFGPLKGIEFISWLYKDPARLVETDLDNYHPNYTRKQKHFSLERGSRAWCQNWEQSSWPQYFQRVSKSFCLPVYKVRDSLKSLSFIEIKYRKQHTHKPMYT